MNKLQLIYGICTLTTLSLTFSITTFAQNNTPIRDRVDNATNARCTIVNNNIDTRITSYNTNKDRHIEKYQKTKDDVQKVVDSLENRDVDTQSLEEDLTTLDQQIRTFGSQYNTFIATLESTKNYDCGESDGEFSRLLNESRTQLRTVRTTSSEIRNLIVTEIRPEIIRIREELN